MNTSVMPASEFLDLLEERDALRTAIALALPVVKAHMPELHSHLMAFAAVQTAVGDSVRCALAAAMAHPNSTRDAH